MLLRLFVCVCVRTCVFVCLFACLYECERQREREGQTERMTDRQRVSLTDNGLADLEAETETGRTQMRVRLKSDSTYPPPLPFLCHTSLAAPDRVPRRTGPPSPLIPSRSRENRRAPSVRIFAGRSVRLRRVAPPRVRTPPAAAGGCGARRWEMRRRT